MTPLAALAAVVCALPAATVPLAAQAQTQPGAGSATVLPPVVVTGSRLPSTPSGLAQSVTVVDRDQIQASHPARLEDLLSRVDGVYVDQAGPAGGFSSLYMRGAENSHLLVMIDGIKVNDPTTTRGSAYDLSSLDVGQIERIEVLRGPASAIHGGEALAGVLNIVTRRASQPGLHGGGHVALGQDGHRRLGGRVSVADGQWSGQLSVGHARDGAGGSDNGLLKLDNASASLRFTPSASIEAEGYVHQGRRESEAFPDDSGGPRLAVNRQKTVRDADDLVYGARLTADQIAGLRLQAGASMYERKENARNAFVAPGVRFPVPAFVSDTDFSRSTVYATATREFGAAVQVVAGLEHQQEDGALSSVGDFDFNGTPENLRFDLKRRTNSIFAEARVQATTAISLQIGLRRDKVQGLDAEVTPHLGAVWNLPGGQTTLKASYSEGFKPPSFFALGFPIGANPALRPERSRNTELTAVHRLDGAGMQAQLSVFQIDYRDLVDFDGATFSNVNRGKIVVRGAEPSLRFRLAQQLSGQLGVTLLDIAEKDGLAPLRNRPEKKASASVRYEIDERSTLYAVATYSGGYLDRSNPTADIRMPGYGTVDAAYSLRIGTALRARLAVDNVFDKKYEQFVGFPAQERRVRAELRAEF